MCEITNVPHVFRLGWRLQTSCLLRHRMVVKGQGPIVRLVARRGLDGPSWVHWYRSGLSFVFVSFSLSSSPTAGRVGSVSPFPTSTSFRSVGHLPSGLHLPGPWVVTRTIGRLLPRRTHLPSLPNVRGRGETSGRWRMVYYYPTGPKHRVRVVGAAPYPSIHLSLRPVPFSLSD